MTTALLTGSPFRPGKRSGTDRALLINPETTVTISMKQMTAPELRDRLQAVDSKPCLLDVREAQEYAYCRIEGSLHIPMNDIPARLGELDPDRETVVVCHHGMRSAGVANYLIRQGFRDVANLTGGVEAWAVQVEPDMPRY